MAITAKIRRLLTELQIPENPDLLSPSLRMAYYAGRSAEEIQKSRPVCQFKWVEDNVLLPARIPVIYRNALFRACLTDDQTSHQEAVLKLVPEIYGLLRTLLYTDDYDLEVIAGHRPVSGRWLPGRIFGSQQLGPSRCDVMIVNAAVTREDEVTRVPGSGPGYDSFWRLWEEAGLDVPTGRVYMTHALRQSCVGFPTSAVTQCKKDGVFLLNQEIRLVKPKWIIALGADALKAVFGRKNISLESCRGTVQELTLGVQDEEGAWTEIEHTAKVVATNMPSQLAFDPDIAALIRASLLHFKKRSTGDIQISKSVVASVDTVHMSHKDYAPIYDNVHLQQEIEASILASKDGGYIAFDCEWHGRHPSDPGAFLYTVQWSHAPNHGRALFLTRQGGEPNTQLDVEFAFNQLRVLFGEAHLRDTRLVGHFAKGDLMWLAYYGLDLTNTYTAPDDQDGAYGWELTRTKGAFDTYVALHCVDETQKFKLEVACHTLLGLERWDSAKDVETGRVCSELGVSKRELPGYGFHDEKIITEYGCGDVDGTGQLFLHLNGDVRAGLVGALDRDRYGNNCRPIFHLLMQAVPVWAEIEAAGLRVDVVAHKVMRDRFQSVRLQLLDQLRRELYWPDLDLAKIRHRVAALYGEQYLPEGVHVMPGGAISLHCTPYKATDAANGLLWQEAQKAYAEGQIASKPSPSTDKEAVAAARREDPRVELIYKQDSLATALKTILRPTDQEIDRVKGVKKRKRKSYPAEETATELPAQTEGVQSPVIPAEELHVERVEEDEDTYAKGLLHHVSGDGRVRSRFGFAETDRCDRRRQNRPDNCTENVEIAP
jgi:uracil-DNA glycosylase